MLFRPAAFRYRRDLRVSAPQVSPCSTELPACVGRPSRHPGWPARRAFAQRAASKRRPSRLANSASSAACVSGDDDARSRIYCFAISIDRADRSHEPGCEIGPPCLVLEFGKAFESWRIGRIELDRLLECKSLTPLVSLACGQPSSERGDPFLRTRARRASGGVPAELDRASPAARRAFQLHPPDYRIVGPAGPDNVRASARHPQTRPGGSPGGLAPARRGRLSGACLPARSSAVRTPSIGNGSTSS